MNKREVRSTPHTIQKRKQSEGGTNDLDNVDFLPSNVNFSHQEALLYVFEWSYDMEGHAKKCVERYCELACGTTQQLCKVSTPCIDDHHFKEKELKSVGELSKVCSQIVLKCLYLARIGRPDIRWSVNKLARSITKWARTWPGRWGPQGRLSTGSGGLARVPNLRV